MWTPRSEGKDPTMSNLTLDMWLLHCIVECWTSQFTDTIQQIHPYGTSTGKDMVPWNPEQDYYREESLIN